MRNVSYEEEFVVVNPNEESILKKNDEPISMIVGIKDLISVLIEFEHINYGIHGTLKGFVSFGKVNLLITKMEVQLIKKETIFGSKTQKKGNPKIIATFELIDGGPYRNETIPFRFFLEPYHLTPSYIDVSGYFSVRYYLNLVIKDNQNNRYFKQKEIFLYRLFLPDKNNASDLSNNNSLNNSLSDVNHLKDYITEPIDYGDYFSVFNDIDEDNDDSNEPNKEEEEDDFYYRSNLKKRRKKKRKKRLSKLRSDKLFEENKATLPVFEDNINRSILNDNNYNNSFNNNYDNNNFNYNENNNINNDNNYNNINNDNNYNNNNNENDANIDVNEKINRMINENNNNLINNISNDNNKNKKSGSNAPKKEKKRKSQVINIKETNKYKNNDILINDNYYSTDNYIIYENSYHNIFDDKLKQSRIKYNKLSEKNSIENNEDEKEKEKGIKMIDDYNIKDNKEISTLNNINDYNLYYPNEPFSNTLIMSNFPSNYGESGQSGNFRQNLMGSRIKKKK